MKEVSMKVLSLLVQQLEEGLVVPLLHLVISIMMDMKILLSVLHSKVVV
jgi:hypothetical protein